MQTLDLRVQRFLPSSQHRTVFQRGCFYTWLVQVLHFCFFFFLFSHLSHKLYPHHTWYIETTQTHMFSCSLTLLSRTSPPGKRHPLPHLWDERRMADGAVSTRVVFLDVNQTNETKGKKKNQAPQMVHQTYHCKIWNIQPSPALTSQRRIMLLPLSLCKKS